MVASGFAATTPTAQVQSANPGERHGVSGVSLPCTRREPTGYTALARPLSW